MDDAIMTSQTSSSLQALASKPALAATSPPNAAAGGNWRMVLAMALSGTIGLLVVESGLPVLWVVWLRCLLGGLGLAAWVLWSGQWSRPTWRESGWLLLGAVALIVNWLCLFRAYEYSGIAIATVVYHVQPFLLLLLAALLQGEPLPLNRLPWLVLALVGVGLSSGLVGLADQQASQGQSLGIVLALLAAGLYALATLATQRLRRLAPAQIAMLQMLVGALSLLPWVWELRARHSSVPRSGLRCWCWAWCIRPGCTH
jgi:drug/metabolite transporter (DMT)-like permease